MAVKGDGGFTLIEVLAAMIVLAVGLLAVQALGIGAVRSVNRAEQQSEVTAAVVAVLERQDALVRSGSAFTAAGESCEANPSGELEVCVAIADAAGSTGTDLVRYEVRAAHARSFGDTLILLWYRYEQSPP